MSKPLTIEELKALPVGDWVWMICIREEKHSDGFYVRKEGRAFNDIKFVFEHINSDDYEVDYYADYGKTWLAYKNKEQAEAKGEIIELPCKVGDTVYLIYSSEQREPIPFVVDFIVTHKLREEERLFVYDSNGYGGRFGDCSKGNYVWYIGTNKSQAEARLKELKGEK